MIDEHGKLNFTFNILKKFRPSYIFEDEDVSFTNTKCPHCNSVIIFSEAHLQPVELDNGSSVPFSDEEGVMIGKCNNCTETFGINVINPDFSGCKSGASKVDYYFNKDGKDINDTHKAHLYVNILFIEDKVERDADLEHYSLPYICDDYPLYICSNCGKNIEKESFKKLKDEFPRLLGEHSRYVEWTLKNSYGKGPEFVIVKLKFNCSCGQECESFFFKKYIETINIKISDFSICNVIGSRLIEKRIIPGVYSKTNIISWLYKLIPRWTILFDKIYIITPFIGHQHLRPAELTEIWIELINRLDHEKSKIWTKNGELTKFKNAYSEVNNIAYDKLNEFELGSSLLSELHQNKDFHAKIYCGISQGRCEVFSGSANLVRGPSVEVMHYDIFNNFSSVYEAFLEPIGIKEEFSLIRDTYSLLFDSSKDFKAGMDGFEIRSEHYSKVILPDR